jgi:N6-adenosine-specific RNA methylase IME4
METKKKYKIIYADPPWKYNDEGCQGTATNHYNTLSIEELCKIPVNELADDDCILFIWGTYPKLPEVLEVIKAWGFEYKSIAFQWIKKNKENGKYFYGLGRWTRGNTEPCFIATKGKPKRINKSVFQIIESKLREHSRKPDVIRQKIIELMGDLPRIELFARHRFEGWDVWGNEIPTEEQKILKLENNEGVKDDGGF